MDESVVLPPMPFLTGRGSLLFLMLGLLLVYLARQLGRGGRLGQRWGVRYSARLLLWSEWTRALGWLLALSSAARWTLARLSPPAALWLSVSAFALLIVTGTFRDIAGALFTRLRYRVDRADFVRVGTCAGQLSSMHWDHFKLRDPLGEVLVVAGRTLLTEPIHVQPRRRGLRLDCSVAAAVSTEALTRLSDTLAISVYRVPETPLTVRAGDGVVQVSLHVWSVAALDAARQQVVDRLRELERGVSPSGSPIAKA